MKKKMCMLEDNKFCDNCCECNTCDINPDKICDNCAQCLGFDEEYHTYTLKELVKAEQAYKKARLQKAKLIRKPPAKNTESLRQIQMN